MSNRLTADVLSKCKALYVPVSTIGQQREVESLVIETEQGFYLISFEEQSSNVSQKIGMFMTPANSDQVAALDGRHATLQVSKFTQTIEFIKTNTTVSLLQEGDYEAEQEIIFRLSDKTQIILKHDRTSIYPYSFSFEVSFGTSASSRIDEIR